MKLCWHQRRFVAGVQRSGRSDRESKTNPKRWPGARRLRDSFQRIWTVSSIWFQPRCASVSSMSRAKRSNTFRLTIATRPPIMSSPAGSRARRETRPRSKTISPPPWKQEPKNDLYQFNLAVIRIRSDDEKTNHRARDVGALDQGAEFRAGSLRALLSDAVKRNDLAARRWFCAGIANESAGHVRRLPSLSRVLPKARSRKSSTSFWKK